MTAVGWHRLARVLAVTQAVALAVAVAGCHWLGLDIRWTTAATAAVVVSLLYVAGTWLAVRARASRSPLRWMAPEGVLAFALVASLCLVSLPVQYAGAALARPTIDAALASADALLGVHVPAAVEWTRARPGLLAVLAVAYDSFGLQVLLAAPVLVLLGRRDRLWECLWHLHVCLLVTLACFAVFPAACAFTFYGYPALLPQDVFLAHFDGYRTGALRVIDFRDVTGLVSAPSFHAAGAIVITWAVRDRWWTLAPLAALNGLLCAATVLTGAHYLVDVLLSVVLVALSLVGWHRWGRRLLDPTTAFV